MFIKARFYPSEESSSYIEVSISRNEVVDMIKEQLFVLLGTQTPVIKSLFGTSHTEVCDIRRKLADVLDKGARTGRPSVIRDCKILYDFEDVIKDGTMRDLVEFVLDGEQPLGSYVRSVCDLWNGDTSLPKWGEGQSYVTRGNANTPRDGVRG